MFKRITTVFFSYIFFATIFISLPAYASKVKPYEDHTLRPRISWVPLEGTISYKVTFKKINQDGSSNDAIINETVFTPINEFQPDTDLEIGQIYKVTVKSDVENSDKFTTYIKANSTFISLHANELQPDNTLLSSTSTYDINESELFGAGVGAGDYRAVINLPDNATITKIKVYYQVNNTNPTVVELKRDGLADLPSEVLASIALPSTTGYNSSETTAISSPIIFNSLYEYFIQISDLDASDGIQRIEVYYYE